MNFGAILICGGVTTLLSLLICFHLILNHWKYWSKPVQQANIIKIIFMAPLFAVDSFVGLNELEEGGETVAHILDMVKECYEAVAIHSFLMLMYDFCGLTHHLNDKKKNVLPDGVKGRELHIPFPLGLYFGHPHFDQKWLVRLRSWTFQFVLLRPILSILDLIFVDLIPSSFSKEIGIVITILLNISVTTAFFALLTFYHAFEEELKPHNPLAKLICIKGVVFFSTWQGVALKLMAYVGILHEGHRFSVDEIELAWQDLLVCIEMGLLFSPFYRYAYSYDTYKVVEPIKTTEAETKKTK